jgi:hypothetical protein
MKPEHRPRFDINTLRELAGDKVFARGEAYYCDRQVEILANEPSRVLAQVAGTEDYRTVLTGRGAEIGGECSCPAFADWGFCKHMVAAALTANAAGAEGTAQGDGAFAQIRDHLKAQGIDALVDMVVGLAERDLALFRKLDMAAATAGADDRTLATRLREAIDGATRIDGFIDYYEASGWAAGVAEVLDTVADLVPAGRASLALTLVEHAIDEIEQAFEGIDDSDGHLGALLERASDIHLAACRAAPPDPVALARDLFARELVDDHDAFYNSVAVYNEVLGEAGLAEYRRLAIEAWEELPPRTAGDRARDAFADHDARYAPLRTMLDYFAERTGGVEARIALRAKDLSTTYCYLELAEFCLAHGRPDEALRHAEAGLWLFEDEPPDERLVFFAVELLAKADRKNDALEQLWRAFAKAPSLALFKRLRRLGGTQARERSLERLRARLAEDRPTPWSSPADLLIQVLMEEKMWEAAWATVRQHGASPHLKHSLAKASEATHPDAARAVYAARVDELVEAGGNHSYQEAAGLIARIAALHGTGEQAAYVADLKERFRRKRNFIRLLG